MALYATWNPSDKDADVTLSNGNLTAHNAAGGTVRATIGVSSGKWYWEVNIDDASGGVLLGVANGTAALGDFVGSDANGWGYYSLDGHKFNNGADAAYGATYTTNAVIGVKLDMDSGTIEFLKNNISQGTAYTGLTGTLYPAWGPAGGSSPTAPNGTANFGATAFVYSVPSGYNAGVYDPSQTLVTGVAGTSGRGAAAPSSSRSSTGNGASSALGVVALAVTVALSGLSGTGSVDRKSVV